MNLDFYLQQPFAQHALLAGAMIAVTCGLIGPFVVMRGMAFAVHGTSELAFTGAAAGLLIADNAVAGALVGAVVVAALLAALGGEQRDRDSTIGVVLAFGLGVGVYLLGKYHGFATAATNILFGDIFGVSNGQLLLLLGIGAVVAVVMLVIRRPLLFASVDADVARAHGVPARTLGALFLVLLGAAAAEASQITGALLVFALLVLPAATAQLISPRPARSLLLSVALAVATVWVALFVAYYSPYPIGFWLTTVAFGGYVVAAAVPRLRLRVAPC